MPQILDHGLTREATFVGDGSSFIDQFRETADLAWTKEGRSTLEMLHDHHSGVQILASKVGTLCDEVERLARLLDSDQ